MTNSMNWKTIAIGALVATSLLVLALNPLMTFACGHGSGGGC